MVSDQTGSFGLLCLLRITCWNLINLVVESDSQTHQHSAQLTSDQAWSVLLVARDIIDSTNVNTPFGLAYDQKLQGGVRQCDSSDRDCILSLNANLEWQQSPSLNSEATSLFDLYLPFLSLKNNGANVVGHLGQSLDAQIATESGDAFFVTGPENRKHLHRMRALAQAVVVGVETVVTDNPQLTTRDVAGKHPIRVVVDPSARMPLDIGIACDSVAPTWVIQASDAISPPTQEQSEFNRFKLPMKNGRLDMADIISILADQGIRRVFVEGGGLTVSGMLTRNCLDYFQLAAAPVFVGSGRASVQLPKALSMSDAFRPPFTLYRMGADVLWNFDLRSIDASESGIDKREAFDACVDNLPEIERLL